MIAYDYHKLYMAQEKRWLKSLLSFDFTKSTINET